jgi:hypothetical protein
MPQRAMRSPAISQGRPVTRGNMGVADLRFEVEPLALNDRKAPFCFLTLVLTSACVNRGFAIFATGREGKASVKVARCKSGARNE